MTKDECRTELGRLATAWNVTIQAATTDAIFSRISHVTVDDWKHAVDELLVNLLGAPRAGLLDHVLKAIETVSDHRRRVGLDRERRTTKYLLHSSYRVVHDDPQEREYGTFRLNLIRRGVNEAKRPYTHTLSDGTVVRITDRITMAKIHVDGLSAWLGEEAYATWARETQVGAECGFHKVPHSLLSCLTDELKYWTLRAAGKTEREAKIAVAA